MVYEYGIDDFTVNITDNNNVLSCRDKSHPHLERGNGELTYQQMRITVYRESIMSLGAKGDQVKSLRSELNF